MIADLIARAATEDWDAVQELEQLAKADPAALRPHLREMLDQGLLWPPALFAGMDEEFAQLVIARIDAGGEQLGRLLSILAEARGDSAAAAFRRWRESPPPAMERLSVDVVAYARQGGWDFRPDGTAHELYGPIAYELRMVEISPGDPAAGGTGTTDATGKQGAAVAPTQVLAADDAGGESRCPWCESPIWTVLDLDTAAPEVARALAHTGWVGRLRVTTCFLCTNYPTLFTDVTPDGGAVWSARNERPDYLRTSTEEPPRVRAEVGPVRATPRLASAWEGGGSTLGGAPDWIQNPEYPPCPACALPMDYVGLVGGADLGWGEGADYIFVHAGCGTAAVTYQQS